jgi:Mor family transcriptional regulator
MQNRNAETNLLHQILLKCKHKKQKGKQGKCKNPLLDYVVPFSHSSMHHGHGKRVLQVLQNHLRLSFNSYQNDFVEKNQPGKKDCLMMMMLMKRNNASSDFQPTPASTFQVETYYKIFTNCNCSSRKTLRKFVQKHRFQVITKALREIFLNHGFQ